MVKRSTVVGIVSLALVSVMAITTAAPAETATERRERLRQERQQQIEQRRQEQQQRRAARQQRDTGGATATAGEPAANRPDASPRTIERHEAGFSLTSVAGWADLGRTLEGNVVLELTYVGQRRGQMTAVFRVYAQDLPGAITAQRMAEQWKQQLQYDAAPVFSSLQNIDIDGVPGVIMIYDAAQDGIPLTDQVIFVTRGQRGYALQTTAPQALRQRALADAQQMARSLKWVGEVTDAAAPDATAPDAVAPGAPVPDAVAGQTPDESAASAPQAPAPHPAAASSRRYFNSADGGISLEYPDTWHATRDMPMPQLKGAVYFGPIPEAPVPGKFHEHLAVIIMPVPPTDEAVTTRTHGEALVKEARGDSADFELLESGLIEIAGGEAYRFVERHRMGELHVQRLVVLAVEHGRQYLLQYSGDVDEFEQHLPAVEAAIQTARWTAPPGRSADAALNDVAAKPSGEDAGNALPAPQPVAKLPDEAQAKIAAAGKDLRTYEDAAYSFSLKYPSAWRELEIDPAHEAFARLHLEPERFGSSYRPRVLVAVQDRSPLMKDAKGAATLLLRMLGEGEVIAEAKKEVGGAPAYEIIAETRGGVRVRSLVSCVEKNQQFYMVRFAARAETFEAWLPEVRKMVESIR